jgi:RNA polymerase sigma factor (sigma-70 family)
MVKLRESADLLEAFRRGDRAALEAVYWEYSEHLMAMLKEGFAIESSDKRYLFEGYREPWDLETAAQEIFARAFSRNARRAYDGLRPYRNYLFTIARNYVVDSFREKKRVFVSLEDVPDQKRDVAEEPGEGGAGPEDFTLSRELEALLEKFVAALDPFEKEIFALRFAEGRSVEASARQAGVSDYRVKRTERRIKTRFYRFMKQRGYFEGFHYRARSLKTLMILLLGAWRQVC